MVKSENLMLGDWVLEGRNLCLKFITSLEMREEYTPISLSDRILEKHGFEKRWIGNRFFHRYVTKKYVVEIYLELGLIRISTVCTNQTLYDGQIEYVHELQHLMKMFNIMVIDMRGCGFNEKNVA